MSDDPQIAEFFDRLEAALFPRIAREELPADWRSFRQQCEERELAGRDTFGHAYLRRDNAAAGLEEAADGANYGYFDIRRTEAQAGDVESVTQLALMAAQKFYEGYSLLRQIRSKAPAPPPPPDPPELRPAPIPCETPG